MSRLSVGDSGPSLEESSSAKGDRPPGRYMFFVDEPGWVRLPFPHFNRHKTVWHHTDAGGLKGILENKTVWASSFRSLNDSSEVHFGIKVLRKLVRRYLKRVDPESANFLRSIMTNSNEDYIRESCFVFCATKTRDSLNQWQHYSNRQGYAVGLTPSLHMLTESGQAPDRRRYSLGWANVMYGEDKQYNFGYAFLDFIVARFNTEAHRQRAHESGHDPLTMPASLYIDFTSYFITACKHAGFKAEREVRYIAATTDDTNLHFRPGTRGVVPYVHCAFDKWSGETLGSATSLHGVLCGPGTASDRRQDIANMQRLLDAYGYRAGVELDASSIPYRF